MHRLSVNDVYRIMHGSRYETHRRRMLIHKSNCANRELGAVFFALEGTPSHAYGIFSLMASEEGTMSVYNSHGRRLRILRRLRKRKFIHCFTGYPFTFVYKTPFSI